MTEEGERQARQAGKGLKDVDFQICVSSPLGRTVSTAELILEDRPVKIVTDEGLKEMSFGDLEGKPIDEVFDPAHKCYYTGFKAHNGETPEETGRRVFAVWERLSKDYSGNVLTVSHGWAIRSGLRMIDRPGVDEAYGKGAHNGHCSLTVIDVQDGVFTIEKMFDTDYMENAG